MNKDCSPEELAESILKRSICAVQVGAVLSDKWGIFGWGWNHMGGDGMGEHAEVNALKRSNRNRVCGATLYVASQRLKNSKAITSKPCENCRGWIEALGVKDVFWRGGDGLWRQLS